MSADFGQDFAAELADYFISGTDITAPPATVWRPLVCNRWQRQYLVQYV